MWLTLVVVLSFVTWRVTRFVLDDSLFREQRNWLLAKILRVPSRDRSYMSMKAEAEEQSWWRTKLFDLFTCPYCFSVWVAAGAVALTDWQTSVPFPVWTWLAASTGALMTRRWIEE